MLGEGRFILKSKKEARMSSIPLRQYTGGAALLRFRGGFILKGGGEVEKGVEK